MRNKIITSAEELNNLPSLSIVAFTDNVDKFENSPEMKPDTIAAQKLDQHWFFTAHADPSRSVDIDFTACTGVVLWPLPIEDAES
ncbi:hypothetical protein [Mycobacteroides abscessus]|uniref:hypothetical protein n=1 Tax=Mycobacteroides abscessus TaxID=36809 RepID=UPI0009278960|nr:hypothetical protein [Mycobacteroides abscessus]SHU54797.1 Uncharacterised protein [Mycobacteroides abscessus subsp. bolletii]SHW63400.1 Uncharacterised protein [Mycobacteroides abscessus subsp. bolletii]SHW91464.1 Uncharacterised protein [Mycobacteroides abscessus subsp. bolletii]SHX33706.1 Uncharacterised protein [Mycobacteroides abscessus subsp. bolletii]SKV79871.1 Uncharacterised protein [Mycobacteroides abscessus subsp. bolletii]